MSHFENYIVRLSEDSPAAAESVKNTVEEIIPAHLATYNHRDHLTGMLLGQVQSGKTAQMFGILAAAADEGFDLFVVLTSSINVLQRQTAERAMQTLDTFTICDEHDEMRFNSARMRKPAVIILKKNTRVLRKWKNVLSPPEFSRGRSVFVIDDEADAASLNTQINQEDQSAINSHLEDMKNLFTGSFYLQVTATPQSLLLQREQSGWRPSFVHYFPPGKGYLGGSFFYSKPEPFTTRFTEDDELEVLLETDQIPEGLKQACDSYLITASHILSKKESEVCNFLVHPSIRIDDHSVIAKKTQSYINYVLQNLHSEEIEERLRSAREDIKSSKPDVVDLDKALGYLESDADISVHTMNSSPESDPSPDLVSGMNIVVGGNSLGRGVTFKGLQTVYYCRSSKKPQADTFWQHSRMFGYDRDPLLMRVFMPRPLFNMFAEISSSNEALYECIQAGKLDDIQLVFPPGIRPTRANVVDQDKLSFVVGGVNYFPPEPDQNNADVLDEALSAYEDGESEVSLDEAAGLLSSLRSSESDGWIVPFIEALEMVKTQSDTGDSAKLIVSRGRDIGHGTGTLLSPDDRETGASITSRPVITLYRLTGSEEKGWQGEPFWVPNIKLPSEKVFYRINED